MPTMAIASSLGVANGLGVKLQKIRGMKIKAEIISWTILFIDT